MLIYPKVKEAALDGMRISEAPQFQAFVIPVGTPFPNIWHALHWWVPALSLKEEQGWKADHLQVSWMFKWNCALHLEDPNIYLDDPDFQTLQPHTHFFLGGV